MKFPWNIKFWSFSGGELFLHQNFYPISMNNIIFRKICPFILLKKNQSPLNAIALCKYLSMKGVFSNLNWKSNISNTRRIFMANILIVWMPPPPYFLKNWRVVHNLQKKNHAFFLSSIFFFLEIYRIQFQEIAMYLILKI